MINFSKKLMNNNEPSKLDEEVAKVISELENSSELKSELKNVFIQNCKEFDVSKNNARVILIMIPYRYWKNLQKIQGRLIAELEKKFPKKHVVFAAHRTMMKANLCKKKGFKVLPRSRTLTAVYASLLEDIVGPTEIVGKRLRVRQDSSELLKIHLDPRDKTKDNLSEKLHTFSAVYKALTNKEAEFEFPEHVY
eukprot:GHVL01024095.1.p1 GENE.GHVL01024095.1~~GHVL01024095.1.p1  ORF type:complete len:194 (+),score=27.68 GHVL01024095.1:62-643(+)